LLSNPSPTGMCREPSGCDAPRNHPRKRHEDEPRAPPPSLQ
jgi:hypothetical protein